MAKKGRKLKLKLAAKKVHDSHKQRVTAHKLNPEKSHRVSKIPPAHKHAAVNRPGAKKTPKSEKKAPVVVESLVPAGEAAEAAGAVTEAGTAGAPSLVPVTPVAAAAPAQPVSIPYSDSESILLIGEGNFSFSSSLATLLGNAELVTATAYDTEEEVHDKYPDAVQHTTNITDLGGTVLYGVDATRMHAFKALKEKKFHKIIFNFPHAGAGIKDQAANILTNQQLLAGFFQSAKQLLTSPHHKVVFTSMGPMQATVGEVHVTLKTGLPYDSWQIKSLAKAAGLRVKACGPFRPERYPGYEHRRTIGFDATKAGNTELQEKECKTWVFVDIKGAALGKRQQKADVSNNRRRMHESAARSAGQGSNKKRKQQDSDSDSD